jgi:hypothetical protein
MGASIINSDNIRIETRIKALVLPIRPFLLTMYIDISILSGFLSFNPKWLRAEVGIVVALGKGFYQVSHSAREVIW